MKLKIHLHKLNHRSLPGILIILLIAILGIKLMISGHAQSPYVSQEAESGVITSPATINPDTNASGGNSVYFGNIDDPSGQNVPIGNQPNWRQIYYDNFANENVPIGGFSNCSFTTFNCSGLPTNMQSKWFDYPDGTLDTQMNCQYWPSQTLSIANGIMNMFIHTSDAQNNPANTCMTAVPEPKLPGAGNKQSGQLYGMYSIRFRSDSLPRYKTAFLLWPDNNQTPYSGEIDFPEGGLDNTFGANLHWEDSNGVKTFQSYPTTYTYTSWHTATIEWSPTDVKFILDGQVIGDSTTHIPTSPMHWVLQTEDHIYANAPKPLPSVEGNLQIDWVSIWAYDTSVQ